MKTRLFNIILILSSLLNLLAFTPTQVVHAASPLTVNTLTDENDHSCADSDCSLRDALEIASDGDAITFNVTGTILLTLGQLSINDSITITGPGTNLLTINGNSASRIFYLTPNETATISGLTLTNGLVNNDHGGAIYNDGTLTLNNMVMTSNQTTGSGSASANGGAIYNNHSLTVTNSTINNNTAWLGGGAIYSNSSSILDLSNVVVDGNKAYGAQYTWGGGIYISSEDILPAASLTMDHTTVTNNTANSTSGGISIADKVIVDIQDSSISGNTVTRPDHEGSAGGIEIVNDMQAITIANSTIDNNTADAEGSGIAMNYSNLTIINSTISNNKSTSGLSVAGAIYAAYSSLKLYNTTVSNNTSVGNVGGIYTAQFSDLTMNNTTVANNSGYFVGGLLVNNLTFSNSLVANNTMSGGGDDPDCWSYGTVTSQGHNLLESEGGCPFTHASGDITGVDPKLNLLADNGGPTQTQSLQFGSPAIDAGDNATCESTDQRGLPRPKDSNGDGTSVCDIGAFEKQGTTFADVPDAYWAAAWIETLYHSGITGGCGTNPLIYCPDNQVTRAQMAVFLEKSLNGSGFTPADVLPSFNDTAGHWAEDWIEALKADAITSGCGNNNYCPESPVTRAQMAIFLLKAEHGASYVPPAASGSKFGDVPSNYWAADWVEQLSSEGITSGCGNNNYCPDDPITRAQMAVFLVKTFNLP